MGVSVILRMKVERRGQVCDLLYFTSLVELSGPLSSDWVQDKIRSQFALQGICWQRSYIPKLVWQVGDSTSNIIESLHADANAEGTLCTLVGGVKKGQHLDKMKLQSIQVCVWAIPDFPILMSCFLLRYLRRRVFDPHTKAVMFRKIFHGE
jgi:hypothetical protein